MSEMSDTTHTEDTFSASNRFNFATQHLRAATRAAKDAYEVEEANPTADLGPWFDDMMQWVPVSVVMAAAALEANANEIIQDILDGSSLPATNETKQLLTDLKEEKAGNTCDKYRRLARLFDKEPELGTIAWQDAKLLVRFRNHLMHFKPTWDHEDIHDGLVKGLKTRIQVFRAYKSAKSSSVFPYGFMTYGCSKWSVATVRAFSESFSMLLGVNDTLRPRILISRSLNEIARLPSIGDALSQPPPIAHLK